MIFTPIALIFLLWANSLINVDVMGLHLGGAPVGIVILFGALSLALLIWEYRVLVREDLRQLFGLPNRGT